MTDFAQLFKGIIERLDSRHEPKIIQSINEKTGERITGHFLPSGDFRALWASDPTAKFPAVTVFDQTSLIHYLARYGATAIDQFKAVLYVNQQGLVGVIDYGAEGAADYRRHQVKFPAAWNEDCKVAANSLVGSVGKWMDFDTFEELIGKCAPFVANFLQIDESLASIDGTETVKIKKTARSLQLEVKGEVSSSVEIPKAIVVQLGFMGYPITAELPLRLQVSNKQVQFFLIDNGAMTKAMTNIIRQIKADVAKEFENLLVIEGSIS